jgi:hypothetical protein
VDVGTQASQHCFRGDPVGLAPERSHADISNDLVLVTAGATWPDGLTLVAHPSTTPGRFTLVACNRTPSTVVGGNQTFNYVVIDVP